jgi:hypothetical protein
MKRFQVDAVETHIYDFVMSVELPEDWDRWTLEDKNYFLNDSALDYIDNNGPTAWETDWITIKEL